jgi:hypothetical protein
MFSLVLVLGLGGLDARACAVDPVRALKNE